MFHVKHMIDAMIVFVLAVLAVLGLVDAFGYLRNYLAALDGQMEAETTEEQP